MSSRTPINNSRSWTEPRNTTENNLGIPCSCAGYPWFDWKMADGSKHGCIFFPVGPQRPARSMMGTTQKLIHVASEHTP